MALRRYSRVLGLLRSHGSQSTPLLVHAQLVPPEARPTLKVLGSRFLSSTAQVGNVNYRFFTKDFVQIMGTVMIVNAGISGFLVYNLKDIESKLYNLARERENNAALEESKKLSSVAREIREIDAALEESKKLLEKLQKLMKERDKLMAEMKKLETGPSSPEEK